MPADPNYNYAVQALKGVSTGYRFLDELIPSFLSIDTDGRVIRLDTFSKTLAPGCRLGWITAQPKICEQLFRVTDGTTQQPSGFVQAIVAQLLSDHRPKDSVNSPAEHLKGWGPAGWVRRLEGLRDKYASRMITMATIFEENRFLRSEAGNLEIFTFNWPLGGMFLWVKVNIFTHPLVSSVDPRRLTFALWILCVGHPYRILTIPGKDFATNSAIKDDHGYLYLRFCFAAVEETVLVAKSRSFVEACRHFWSIRAVADIDDILREEDALESMSEAAREEAESDRLVIEE